MSNAPNSMKQTSHFTLKYSMDIMCVMLLTICIIIITKALTLSWIAYHSFVPVSVDCRRYKNFIPVLDFGLVHSGSRPFI